MSRSLKAYLKASGFEIKCGQLEVFPSGNGIRLPLQDGFAWLDESGEMVLSREELSTDEAIGLFVHDIESATNDWAYTKLRIAEMLPELGSKRKRSGDLEHQARVSAEGLDDLFSNRLISENYQKGRQYWTDGLGDNYQRHEAIICVGHYLWFGDSEAGIPAYPGSWNDRARERLIRKWLEDNHNGYCRHINRGDWGRVEANIERAVHWRRDDSTSRESYPLTERSRERLIQLTRRTGRLWHMDDLKKANEDREKGAREKIKEAVEELLREGRRVSGRAIAAITGCSRNTVKKHSDIWLQSGSGVYNPGVWGIGSSLEQEQKEEKRELDSEKLGDAGWIAGLVDESQAFAGSEDLELPESKSVSLDFVGTASDGLSEDEEKKEIETAGVVLFSQRRRTVGWDGLSLDCEKASENSLSSVLGFEKASIEVSENEKASIWALKGSKNSWLDDVTRLIEKDLSELSVLELKSLLALLAVYLSRAPSCEEQVLVQGYMSSIRGLLQESFGGKLFVVRPP